jgi:putative restriction endonuclease
VRDTRGYFATARVKMIVPDPQAPGNFLALIEPKTYLDFASPVAFNDSDGPIERGLLNNEGRISGRAQSAVRPLSDADFKRIIERGLDDRTPFLPREGISGLATGFEEEQAPFVFEGHRDRALELTSRAVRDRVFRRIVLQAYGERCAMTGLKLINGGGRAEVQAAHIMPVEKGGPDSVRNGLALSGTAHWMFDRGLISLGDDLQILISRQANDADGVRAFVNRSGFAHVPARLRDRPHSQFLAWHRENCFKH